MPSSSTPPSHGREPEYQIQLAAVCHHEDVNLPTFCQSDLIWLLEPTLKGQYQANEAPLIGVALSVVEDAHPDVLALSHKQRLLMLQVPELDEDSLEGTQPGLDLLKKLLLCSSPGDIDECFDPLRNTEHAGMGLQVAALSASEIAYLLYNSLQADSCFLDLDLLAADMGCEKVPPFNALLLIKAAVNRQKAIAVLSLEPDQFLVKREETELESAFLLHLIGTVRMAVGSYEAGNRFWQDCLSSDSKGPQVLERAKVDTRRISPRLIGYLARFEAVETALQVSKPKTGQSRLRKGDQGGIEFKLAKDGKRIEVINEQYKSRLARNTRQFLDISLTDSAGHSRIFTAKTVASAGKTSCLEFVGKDAADAVRLVRGGAVSLQVGSTLDSVEIRGREDHSAAEIEGMRWRRQIMSVNKQDGRCMNEDCDSSQLLCPFLLGDKSQPVDRLLDSRIIRLMDRPERHQYNTIAARERKGTLNTSQARAAKAILSPLTGTYSTVGGADKNAVSWSEKDWQQQERFCLVHGPPGTGKTSLITACCEQWEYSCSNLDSQQEHARDTIYACCQSNVAVKNIAESFSRAGINFKIIVSANFYVEWHEDLYADIKSRFLRADELPASVDKLAKLLEGCSVVLSTVSFLSSPKIVRGDCLLFRIRPMRLLFVDEASQIHLRAYPQLLQRFGSGLARIVFLGDDRQLPPFQGDEIIDAGLSVFELAHLRKKAFLLDTCYRLAKPMAVFISDNVYDGLLQCGSNNYDPEGGLLDCVSFIDVETGKEERQGTSRINRDEVQMVVRLVSEYKKRGGAMAELKVLTTYDAQRDALEEALKRANLSGASDVVFSVDSFQGRESDYIILSLVKDGRPTVHENRSRSGMQKYQQQVVKYLQPGLGFLSNDRRINVALTRAKKGIVVVSNRRFVIDTASETLVGKLQVEMQWLGTGGEMHWCDQDDVRNNRMPRALFGQLPKYTQVQEQQDEVPQLVEEFAKVEVGTRCEPNGWD